MSLANIRTDMHDRMKDDLSESTLTAEQVSENILLGQFDLSELNMTDYQMAKTLDELVGIMGAYKWDSDISGPDNCIERLSEITTYLKDVFAARAKYQGYK